MSQPETPSNDLVVSRNPGRLAVGDAQYGPDLSDGVRVAIRIGDTWVKGRVEHSKNESVGYYAIAQHGQSLPGFGYFVLLDEGSVLGLCSGMAVRVLGIGE